MTEQNSTPLDMTSAAKICTKCGEIKMCNSNYFAVSKTGRFGFASACKLCQRAAYSVSATADPERFRGYAKKSYGRNILNIRARVKGRRSKDPAYALRLRVSSLVRQSISRSCLGTSWIKLLGFSAEDLRDRMESLFTKGMTWESFLRGDIEIDHMIPVSFFNPSDPKSLEFRMCWSLKNLQPLWKRDNRMKGDSLPDNFAEVWNELYLEAAN